MPKAIKIMLLALLGSDELCEVWWNSPNKGFDGRRPNETPIEEVKSYLLAALSH